MTYRAIVTVNDPYGRPQQVGGEVIHEEDDTPVFTGILNADGVPLFRLLDKGRLGFDLGWDSVDTLQAEADVMTCLNAFCRPGGRIYFSGRARERVDKSLNSTQQVDHRRLIEFLDTDGFTGLYREGNWFFQKYHSEAAARALAVRFIGPQIRYDDTSNSWRAMGVKQVELPAQQCRAAIAREFNLMWPAGRRVGRADRMLAAWDRARNTPHQTASSGRS